MTKPINENKMRLDKWLFCSRFFKTRSSAQKAIQSGKVFYEGQKPNPSRDVDIGATLTIHQGNIQKSVTVVGLSQHRLSASLVKTLYIETQTSIEGRKKQELLQKEKKAFLQSAPKPTKRPEKGARRLMRQMRRES